MAYPTMEAVARLQNLLAAEEGLAASLTVLKSYYGMETEALEQLAVGLIRAPAELQEKAGAARYPVIQTYCDQIESKRTERFRMFSGRLRMVTEVRMSQDRLEGLAEKLHFYVDAVCDVVERNGGCVDQGLFLEPGYEVSFDPVKKGGLNYLQIGRVTCWMDLNQ